MTGGRHDIATLHARVTDALLDLDALPADDPAAENARHAVRLTQHTLEYFWLPTLERMAAATH